ncbi:MAG: hypothetical protein RJB61_560, partial [Actinomycetota bacterium]
VIVHLAGATTLVGVTAWLWSATSEPDTEQSDLSDAGPGHATGLAQDAVESAQR